MNVTSTVRRKEGVGLHIKQYSSQESEALSPLLENPTHDVLLTLGQIPGLSIGAGALPSLSKLTLPNYNQTLLGTSYITFNTSEDNNRTYAGIILKEGFLSCEQR